MGRSAPIDVAVPASDCRSDRGGPLGHADSPGAEQWRRSDPGSRSARREHRRAFAILRLSGHNTLGIGDAENDHELPETCEVGVAVAWGSSRSRCGAATC
jgi:hypothetical protein